MGRSRLMDYLARRDMARGRRRDRGMDYGYSSSDYGYSGGQYDMRRGDRAYSQQDNARGRRDYESSRQYDGNYGYGDMRGDMHYQPVEAMGYFTGYYGGGEDYARRRNSRGQYMRDRGYDMGYDYGGDYGENLSKEEIEKWHHKLEREVDEEQAKHFFKKENIEQKARQLGVEMHKFNAEELALASLMIYTDYCKELKPYVGNNMDVYIKLGKAFLVDPDSAVKGGEKLALYQDLVSGEDD